MELEVAMDLGIPVTMELFVLHRYHFAFQVAVVLTIKRSIKSFISLHN